jgi:predicted flavoprotein YhiN
VKASPLLRAWLRRLDGLGVTIKTRHLWTGLAPSCELLFRTAERAAITIDPDAALLALGCASWPKLGSDGQWAEIFANADITVVPLAPANYGVLVTWSDVFRSRFEGAALKRIALPALKASNGAISTAGGVSWGGLDQALMIKARPGIFVAAEMLDWEAPTGGYLLQASFATAAPAANGLLAWIAARELRR